MKLHILPPSPNSKKVMMVNHLTGMNLPEVPVDVSAGAHKSADFLALNPNGLLPTLEFDDGTTLWESNAICNRLAGEAKSDLWPASTLRYDILQWQFWESCHWTPACAKFLSKHLFGNDDVDMAAASETFHRFAAVLDGRLAARDWLVGENMTTADISVGCVLVYAAPCHIPLDGYAGITRWLAALSASDGWAAANPQPTAA